MMFKLSLCGHTRSRTRLSSKIAISQSASLENWGSVLFISLTIAFSSLESISSSGSKAGGGCLGCSIRLPGCSIGLGYIPISISARESNWDRVGDVDRGGELVFRVPVVVPDLLDVWALMLGMLGYLVRSLRPFPSIGRFQ